VLTTPTSAPKNAPSSGPSSPPLTEIGYQVPVNYNWWLYENETTPELVFPQSVYVYDQMRKTDAQVRSVLQAVTQPILRTPWRVDPAGARPEVVDLVADDLALPVVGQDPKPFPRTRDRFSWTEHLFEAMLCLPIGFSYFEQLYRVDPDGSRAHLRKLALRPAKTIEYVNVAEDGGLVSIQQYWVRTSEKPQPIPVDRLVAYVHQKEGGNWLGTSILRSCYKNWLLKDRLLRVQAQTIERNGMGVPLYKAAEGETDLTKGLNMAKAWRAGEAAGSSIPNGADLVLRGVDGTLPDADPAIRYHDEQIARAVLAHFLNLGTQTGSWALGSTFADFFTLSLQTLALYLADVANKYIVEDLVDLNFGENEPAPRITFDEIGSRQPATAEAMKTLVDAGILRPDQVLEGAARQYYGLPPADTSSTRTPPKPSGPTLPEPTQMGDTSVAASAAVDREDAMDSLVVALDGYLEAAFDEAKHPRNPKGSAGGGRFRSLAERLKDALDTHHQGGGKGDPFQGFSREQLRRTAQARGIVLKRGESRDDIAKKLHEHLSPAKKATTLDTVEFQTKDERTATQVLDGAGRRVGAHWKVSDSDLESLIREDGQWEHFQHYTPEQRRERFVANLIQKWNGSSGGPVATAAITHVLDRLGISYELSDTEKRTNSYIRSRPEVARAAASLGDAMYETTQEWFRERGITHVHILRASVSPERDKTRPFTSWTLHRGGLRDAGNRTIREEDIPVSRIFAIPPTGFGNLDESELVVMPLAPAVHAAAGIDTHPGGEQLKHYWVYGEGAAKWDTFTELRDHLLKYLNPEMATRTAAEWFRLRFGFWPGADLNRVKHGKPPRGHRVGPG
jgi:hypothetical protein